MRDWQIWEEAAQLVKSGSCVQCDSCLGKGVCGSCKGEGVLPLHEYFRRRAAAAREAERQKNPLVDAQPMLSATANAYRAGLEQATAYREIEQLRAIDRTARWLRDHRDDPRGWEALDKALFDPDAVIIESDAIGPAGPVTPDPERCDGLTDEHKAVIALVDARITANPQTVDAYRAGLRAGLKRAAEECEREADAADKMKRAVDEWPDSVRWAAPCIDTMPDPPGEVMEPYDRSEVREIVNKTLAGVTVGEIEAQHGTRAGLLALAVIAAAKLAHPFSGTKEGSK